MVLKSAFRKHRLLIAAGFLGFSAAIATYAAISPYVATGPAVVAVVDIDEFQRVEAGHVRVAQLPLKSLPKDRFEDEKEAIGSYALSRIVGGQVVLRRHVSRGTKEAGLSLDMSPEMRCVFVPAGPDRAVGGFIKEGERVDVVFTPRGGGYAGLGGALSPDPVRSVRILKVCLEPSSRTIMGVVALVEAGDAEEIAHNIESCAVSLLLAPRDALVEEELEPEVWLPQ